MIAVLLISKWFSVWWRLIFQSRSKSFQSQLPPVAICFIFTGFNESTDDLKIPIFWQRPNHNHNCEEVMGKAMRDIKLVKILSNISQGDPLVRNKNFSKNKIVLTSSMLYGRNTGSLRVLLGAFKIQAPPSYLMSVLNQYYKGPFKIYQSHIRSWNSYQCCYPIKFLNTQLTSISGALEVGKCLLNFLCISMHRKL